MAEDADKKNVITDNDPWSGAIALTVTITLCVLVLHWAGVL